jgi:ankyrin repeat protein
VGTPLAAAAQAGSLSMLRKLLRAGARIVSNDKRTLYCAVMVEHTAMVELLLEMGAGDANDLSKILEWALEEGLESMAEVLQRHGVRRP